MKLLQNIAVTALTLITLTSTAFCQSSKNTEAINNCKERSKYPLLVTPSELPKSSKIIYAKEENKLQSTPTFVVLDTLFNSYSYYSNSQQPFVYHAETGTLVTIYRGSLEAGIASAPKDTKDNLFIRTSNDWGSSWNTPILAYDATINSNRMGRYPSVYALVVDGELSYLYTSPVTNNSGWIGFANGLYNNNTATINLLSEFTVGTQKFGFTNDAKIVGNYTENYFYGLAISGALPPGGNPLNQNSNIAKRYTDDFSSWNAEIPQGWAASIFNTPTEDSTRSAELVGLKKLSSGKLYMAAYGGFKTDSLAFGRAVVAVSTSEDDGANWTNLEDLRMPYQLLKDYATSVGAIPDSTITTWGEKDFIVMENGDFSIVAPLYEILDTNNAKYEDRYQSLVEIYYKNNAWGIREIAPISGYSTLYFENETNKYTETNQMGSEVQISRTVDGTKLICKWVDFDVDQDGKRLLTDVFIAVRESNSNEWSWPMNITNSPDIYDHITWMPDLLPNDLSKLPIIQMKTLPVETVITNDTLKQLIIDTPCEIVISTMEDAQISSRISYPSDGVKDIEQIQKMSINPNPASEDSYINLTISNSGNLNIGLYDALGQRLSTVYNDYTDSGIKAFKINTKELSSGAYYVRAELNGKLITKIINILH